MACSNGHDVVRSLVSPSAMTSVPERRAALSSSCSGTSASVLRKSATSSITMARGPRVEAMADVKSLADTATCSGPVAEVLQGELARGDRSDPR